MIKFRFYMLFCLLSLPGSVHCQSLFRGFFSLSGPEKCWTISHLFVARKAFRVTVEAKNETVKILNDSILDQFPFGGKTDAFRHCFWMARLTQSIGAKKALSLGKAHEKGNYKDFKKGRKEEGMQPDSLSSVMDLQNNEQGIIIGKNNCDSSPQQLKQIVIDKISEGLLVILKRNASGVLTDCEGKIVVYDFPVWNLPYCIIPSSSQ